MIDFVSMLCNAIQLRLIGYYSSLVHLIIIACTIELGGRGLRVSHLVTFRHNKAREVTYWQTPLSGWTKDNINQI